VLVEKALKKTSRYTLPQSYAARAAWHELANQQTCGRARAARLASLALTTATAAVIIFISSLHIHEKAKKKKN